MWSKDDAACPKAFIRDKRVNTLHLLPASQNRDKTAVSPDAMQKICTELRTMFDFIVIDCPAGIERGFENAIAGADEVIIITTPHVSAIRDADRVDWSPGSRRETANSPGGQPPAGRYGTAG